MDRHISKRGVTIAETVIAIAMVAVLALGGGVAGAAGVVLVIEVLLALCLGACATLGLVLHASGEAGTTPAASSTAALKNAGMTEAPSAPETADNDLVEPSHAETVAVGTDAPDATASEDSAAGGDASSEQGKDKAQAEASSTAPVAFDMEAFERELTESGDPIEYLKQVVGDIRTREAASGSRNGTQGEAPTEFERYLARKLVEAGLLRGSDDLPALGVVMPHRSDTFYIRVLARSISLGSAIRVLRLESALNAALFGYRHFANEAATVTMEELYRFEQALAGSICAQVEGSSLGLPLEGDEPDGEWAVRHALSAAIESVQLPHRLTAQFRTNVAGGDVALQIDLTHSYLFPTSAYVDGLGVVSTTGDMRRISASLYALRLGILLAACAFRSSSRIRRVWVAGVIDAPTSHKCYYTVRFERERFSRIDLGHVDDPVAVYLDAGANLHLMGPQDGSFTYDGYYVHDHAILLPVEQDFSLEDERFCPKSRYDSVALSPRPLTGSQARALGTSRVSGLAISEDDERDRVADDIALNLTSSTEKNVRTIMSVAADDPDLTVRDAAERTIAKLISGQLTEDPFAVREEFANGDALTQAVLQARRDMEAHDLQAASERLEAALAPIDAARTYADTPAIAYRDFSTYVERAIYNHVAQDEGDGRTVLLVPDAYLEAHVMLCFAILGSQGDPQRALEHARRAQEVAPLDMRTNLNLVACLELTGDLDEAARRCRDELRYAHDPQGIAFGYYRMAGLEWSAGEHESAQACYQRCIQIVPQAAPFVMMELASLTGGDASQIVDAMDEDRIEELLEGRDIPVAPTRQVQDILREGVEASLDAEVFPVAKSFANLLGALSGDDVLLGVVRSLEDVPDR